MVAILLVIAALLAPPAAADSGAGGSSTRCVACHGLQNLAVRESIGAPPHDFSVSPAFAASAHGHLTCDQCHGDVGSYPHSRSIDRVRVTCAQDCHARDREGRVYSHAATVADFAASVHGSGARGDPADRPGCLTCHGNGDPHAIPSAKDLSRDERMARCDGCHGDRARMTRNDVDADAVSSYRRSFHYKAIKFGARETAVCDDCHTAHRIRPASDSTSTIASAALPATCGQTACHPGAGARFAVSGANHLDLRVKREPLLWAEEWLFRLLTAGTMAMLVVGIVLDVQKRFGWAALLKGIAARTRHGLEALPVFGRRTIRIARWLLVE
jgi:hypothetical protein